MATTLTETANCTRWYSAWSGSFYDTTPPTAWTLAQGATLHCVRWSSSYAGALDVNTPPQSLSGSLNVNVQNFPSTQSVAVVSSSTIPVELQGTDNRVMIDNYTLGVELPVNVVNFPATQTGPLLVEIDSATYPVPVINQGTAPVEVFFESGATLETVTGPVQLSAESREHLAGILSIGILWLVVLFTILLVYFWSMKSVFTYLRKKLW